MANVHTAPLPLQQTFYLIVKHKPGITDAATMHSIVAWNPDDLCESSTFSLSMKHPQTLYIQHCTLLCPIKIWLLPSKGTALLPSGCNYNLCRASCPCPVPISVAGLETAHDGAIRHSPCSLASLYKSQHSVRELVSQSVGQSRTKGKRTRMEKIHQYSRALD